MGKKCAGGTAVIRLHVIAEGRTEQIFVQRILAPHLARFAVFADARCVRTSQTGRGGLSNYAKAKNDILAWMREDPAQECRFTTMFDLYALPSDFPGQADAARSFDPYARVKHLENALKEDVGGDMFIPYIQLHEFEALLLADPRQLDWEYLEHDKPIQKLIDMMNGRNPELINDGPETAPSKRILHEIPEYKKATAGPAVAAHIGLAKLRKQCRHFNEWLTCLEQLAGPHS